MGHLTSHGDVDAAILAVYVPLIFLILFIFLRHGFVEFTAWLYLIAFAAVRIAGAAMTIDIQLTGSTGLDTAAAILTTVALSPLLLATLAVAGPKRRIPPSNVLVRNVDWALQVDHMVVIIALILAIIGGIDSYSSNASDHSKGQSLYRAGAAIFLVSWAILAISVVINWRERPNLTPLQRNLYTAATIVAVPALLVRIIDTICVSATINTDRTQVFNSQSGSIVAYVLMSFLPEVCVAYSLVIAAIISPKQKFA